MALALSSCGAARQSASNVDGSKRPLVLDMVHHNPGETPYDSAYNDPSVLRDMGYNGKVYFLFESPMLAIDWKSEDADILPEGTPDKEWVDAKAEQIHAMQKQCEDADMIVLAQSDCILFPKRLIEKYDLAGRMGNILDPEVERLLRVQVNEMFDQFPELDGLVTRIGETYLHDAPFHKGAINDKGDADKTIIPLLNILRDEICVKRGKLLVFRTWMSFDGNQERYLKICDAVEPHDMLVIAAKHCEGDFHRSNSFNRNIGTGRHPQIIEVQCAREYEGKGAYPHYVANGVIDGFEEHADMPSDKIKSLREFTERTPELYAGVWTWTRGGGWGGPYIKDELWCDLNAWVIAQWALDPSRSEESIFNSYATEKLNLCGEDVVKFRKMCLLSADAVIRGKSTVNRDLSPWWSRDEGIGYPKFNENTKIYEIISQKEESVKMWGEIVELAKQIKWSDEQTASHVVGSSYYGLYLYDIYRIVLTLQASEFKEDWGRVKSLIEEYDAAWSRYSALSDSYPQIATLYDKDYVRHHATNAEKEVNRLREIVSSLQK